MQKKNKNSMTESEHFKELVTRIVICLVMWVITFVLALSKSTIVLKWLKSIAVKYGYTLIFVAPQDALLQEIRIALLISIVVSLPIIMYEFSKFVFPVFNSNKDRFLAITTEIFSLMLLIVGALFSYKFLIPYIFEYLCRIGKDVGLRAQISVKEFVSLFIVIESSIAITFEMPLITALGSVIGILTPARMIKAFRYVIVVCFIIAAIITPPDVISQIVVALPMLVLYCISIGICKIIYRKGNEDEQKV